jgi:hypothetical protein
MSTRIAIVVNCSLSRNVDPVLCVTDIPNNISQAEALEFWLGRMKALKEAGQPLYTPEQIYSGDGFQEVRAIRQGHNDVVDVKIVTGGQGLIGIEQPILPYDFSGDPKEPHNIHQKVRAFRHGAWWADINERLYQTRTPIADLTRRSDIDLVIVSVTKVFLKYIAADLAQADLDKLIVLTTASNLNALGKGARKAAAIYSDKYLEDTPYAFRHVKIFKALRRFLDDSKTLGVDEALKILRASSLSAAIAGKASPFSTMDYDALFEAHPELLECTSAAHLQRMAKLLNIDFGGQRAFIAAWQIRRGAASATINKLPEIAPDKATEGTDFLTTLISSNGQRSSSSGDDAIPEEVRYVASFVEQFRKVCRAAGVDVSQQPVLAASVTDWIRITYGKEFSPLRIFYILHHYGDLFGCTMLSQNGRSVFRFSPEYNFDS